MTCISIEDYFYQIPSPPQSINRYFLIFFAIICVFGSSVNLLALLKSRNLTPHLLLVASLSIADLTVLLETGIYLTFLSYIPDQVKSCQVNGLIIQTGIIVSILSFGIITLERYLVICRNWQNHERETIMAIACCWIFSILASAPLVFDTKYLATAGGIGCHVVFCSRESGPMYLSGALIILLLIFMILVIYCSYKILALYSNLDFLTGERKRERQENQKKVFIKLGIITATFTVMYSPLAATMIYEKISGTSSSEFLKNVYAFFIGLSSAVNPILFYILDPTIKSRVDMLFGNETTSKILVSSSSQNIQLKPPSVSSPDDYSMRETVKM